MSDTDTSTVRASILGGELETRNLLGRLPATRTTRVVGGVLAVQFLVLALSKVAWWVLVVSLLLLAVGWLLLIPRGGNAAEESVLDAWLRVRRARRRRRPRRGLAAFVPIEQLRPGQPGPAWVRPVPVGAVTPLDLAGTDLAGLFILEHRNPGESPYLSVLCATDGMGTGLRADAVYAKTQAQFGKLMAFFASKSRYVSGWQQLNRVLPHDAVQHRDWMAGVLRGPATTDERVLAGRRDLIASYDELIAATTEQAEQHRNYLVLRFEITAKFEKAARRHAPGAAGWARIVRDELRVLENAGPAAGLGRVEILGEQRCTAAMLALQSPDYPPDRHGGLSWADAFLSITAPEKTTDHIVVDGRWLTRTAYLPATGLSPILLGPGWLGPVIIKRNDDEEDLAPRRIVRTVSCRADFVTPETARAEARADATTDTSVALRNANRGKIDDGTDETLLSASMRRKRDLTPASGHAGLDWMLWVTVQADDYDDLLEACSELEEASADCGITRWVWCDHDQDTAWPAMLALGRGKAAA